MSHMLVKRKLGKKLKLWLCTVALKEAEAGPDFAGNAWIGRKQFAPEDEYMYDSELPEAPYAGPNFSWAVRCPKDAWHFAFTVLDEKGDMVLRAIEFMAPLQQDGVVLIDPVEESDPHWTGARGDVASALACALAERIPDRVAACGPPGMLAAVARKLRAVGVAGEHASFAIERQMKCALGICGRCYAEDSYVCREGPVFTLAELDDIDPTVAGHA